MRVRIKDVAERAGVSTTMVSLYLNHHPLSARMAEKTKQRIDEAVRELNYQPSATASEPLFASGRWHFVHALSWGFDAVSGVSAQLSDTADALPESGVQFVHGELPGGDAEAVCRAWRTGNPARAGRR